MRQGAAPWVRDRMTGSAGVGELRYDVKKISGSDSSHGKVAKDRVGDFSCARTMAAQAVLVLIDGRTHGRDAIRSVDSGNAVLRGAGERRRREGGHLVGRVAIVAVRASRVAIAVENQTFGGVVRIRSRGEGVADFCKFGEDVWDGG